MTLVLYVEHLKEVKNLKDKLYLLVMHLVKILSHEK